MTSTPRPRVQAFAPPPAAARRPEQCASGNFVERGRDYAELVRRSSREPLLRALYQRAGRSLDDDSPNSPPRPRTAADPAAVAYVAPLRAHRRAHQTAAHAADHRRPADPDRVQRRLCRGRHRRRPGRAGCAPPTYSASATAASEPGEVLAALQTLEGPHRRPALAGRRCRAEQPRSQQRRGQPGLCGPSPRPLLRLCWNQRAATVVPPDPKAVPVSLRLNRRHALALTTAAACPCCMPRFASRPAWWWVSGRRYGDSHRPHPADAAPRALRKLSSSRTAPARAACCRCRPSVYARWHHPALHARHGADRAAAHAPQAALRCLSGTSRRSAP